MPSIEEFGACAIEPAVFESGKRGGALPDRATAMADLDVQAPAQVL
jgi:hypothetical protein